MSNGVHPVGLTYDDVELQEDDLSIHLQLTAGLDDSPEVRGVDVTVPYLAGRVVQPRVFDRRRLLLEGHVTGEDREAYRASRRVLSILFDNTRLPATLHATTEDGDVVQIEARPLELQANEVVPGAFAYISITLEAVSEWEGLTS